MPLFFRHSLLDLSLEAILLSFPVKMEWGKSGNIIKILKIYIMLSCTHLYHFFPVSIQYLQCIHCLLHQTLENQLLTIYQGVHITYFSNLKFSWCCVSDSETKFYVIWHLYLTSNIMSFNFFVILVAIFYQTFN